MKAAMIRNSVLFVLLASLAIGGGWFIGTTYGTWRDKHTMSETERKDHDLLMANLRGIRIGEQFPDMAIWTLDGKQAATVREVLPAGGVVVLLSVGCQSCVDEALMVQSALDSLAQRTKAVIFIMDGELGERQLSREMADIGVRLPIYADVQNLFRREYRVKTRTAYFSLDHNGVVDEIQAWRKDPSDLRELLSTL